MALKENLQRLMKARGLSEYALAIATRVPQPTVHRICAGKSKDPKNANLEKFARYFGLSVDELRADGEVKSNAGRFTALSQDAIELLSAWERLPPERQQAFKDVLFFEVFALEQMPWLRRGRPVKESYDQFEQRMKNVAKTEVKRK